jgi:hypothetical protein
MPQIKLPLIAILIAAGLTLSGCGSKNSEAVFSQETVHRAQTDWVHTHKTTARANIASCAECHGLDYTGGISKVSCVNPTAQQGFTCHATSPVTLTANLTATPVILQTECVSCHGGSPNGPFDNRSSVSFAPNRQGAHAKHVSVLLPLVANPSDVCKACHLGAGSDTAGHARATKNGKPSPATISFNNEAEARFDGTTCSTVSCHGNKVTPTPSWKTGTIDIATTSENDVCLQCHEYGVQQYNSFNSATNVLNINAHQYHIETQALRCVQCHDASKLNVFKTHFNGVITKTLTSPLNTIFSNYSYGTNSKATKSCGTANGCHKVPDGPVFNHDWK